MNTKGTKIPLENDSEEELKRLRDRIAELEGKAESKPKQKREVKIQQDEYIPVMSLLPFSLNLSTREGGQGSVKKFTKFGEIKNILYKDLIDILEVHSNFLEAGYFYIMHNGFIRQAGLEEIYSKILTKEKIEEILTTNSDGCVSLYESANDKQKEIIVQLLVSKIRENPSSVDLNIVDKISRVSKVDIAKIAEEKITEQSE